jgi:hypothetical protein
LQFPGTNVLDEPRLLAAVWTTDVYCELYLKWVIESNLYSDDFLKKAGPEIHYFKTNKVISAALISKIWIYYVEIELVKKRGNHFTYFYYTTGLYQYDYRQVSKDVPGLPQANALQLRYDKLEVVMNNRFREWVKLKSLFQRHPG